MSNPPGVNIDSSTANVAVSIKPKDPMLREFCTSRICHLTFNRIVKVYGSLDDIRVEIVKKGLDDIDGYVDPVSPKVIHVIKKDAVTIEHELIHVRQYAEYFGNITDDVRRKKLTDMANRMTQEDWIKWNLDLEKEAYEHSGKSPANDRSYSDKLKAAANRTHLSPEELQKMNQQSFENFLKFKYEKGWISKWKILRGNAPNNLAPPAMPKVRPSWR